MKPAVPSAVPYPDMRSWQRLGVKLRGKRSRRVTGTPSREARRNLPARRRRGARDGWVRPTHVNVRESVVMSDKPNVLTRLEPKGMRQGTVLCSLDRHGHHCRRRTGRVRTIRKFMRNRVAHHAAGNGRRTARNAVGVVGRGMRRKRMPGCNGRDTGCDIARRESGLTSARSFMARES